MRVLGGRPFVLLLGLLVLLGLLLIIGVGRRLLSGVRRAAAMIQGRWHCQRKIGAGLQRSGWRVRYRLERSA
eukprot:3964249-Alexandrium_andersonii.AAC.1